MELDRQIASLEKKLAKISGVELHRADASALNKTAAKAKTATASLVSKEARVPVSVVKKRIFIRKAIAGRRGASIAMYAKPVSAVEARISRNAKGWRVAGKNYPGSFLSQMRNQRRHHIYQRKTKKRLPIQMIKVPLAEPVERVGQAVVELHMRKEYPRILQREYSARINGYVKRVS